MKKILFLVSLLFILAGCHAEYNLTIDDNFNETITYFADNNDNLDDFNIPFIPLYYDKLPPSEATNKVNGFDYYNYNNIKDDFSITESSYRFSNLDNFKRGLITNTCIGSIDVKQENDEVQINTLNRFHCFSQYPNLTDVKININLSDKYELIETNAQVKENNKLEWNFNNKDPYNCSIYLKYKIKEGTKETEKEEERNNTIKDNKLKNSIKNIICLIAGVGIFIILIIVLFKLKLQGKI